MTATIYEDDDPIELEGNFWAGMRGSRDIYGAPLEPDDPDEMELVRATKNGVAIELSQEQEERAYKALWEEGVQG